MLGPSQSFSSVAPWSCRPVKSLVPCMEKYSAGSNRDGKVSSSSETREVVLVDRCGVSFPRERAASVQPGLSCMRLFSACPAGLLVGRDAARDFKASTPSLCLKTSPAGARVFRLHWSCMDRPTLPLTVERKQRRRKRHGSAWPNRPLRRQG